MNRRNFLKAGLILPLAPAIVKAEHIMRVVGLPVPRALGKMELLSSSGRVIQSVALLSESAYGAFRQEFGIGAVCTVAGVRAINDESHFLKYVSFGHPITVMAGDTLSIDLDITA